MSQTVYKLKTYQALHTERRKEGSHDSSYLHLSESLWKSLVDDEGK